MITGIRSALICERVTMGSSGFPTLVNVFGDQIQTSAQPSMVEFTLALMLAVDGHATKAELSLSLGDFKISTPIEIAASPNAATLHLPVIVPILEPGILTLTIDDVEGGTFTQSWRADFAPNARVAAMGASTPLHCR